METKNIMIVGVGGQGSLLASKLLGRLLLTDGLLKFIGIDLEKEESRNVVLVGCGEYGEIWSEEEYNSREIDPEAIRLALENFGL